MSSQPKAKTTATKPEVEKVSEDTHVEQTKAEPSVLPEFGVQLLSIKSELDKQYESVKASRTIISEQLKILAKVHTSEMKTRGKKKPKQEGAEKKQSQSGFNKPSLVPDTMCEFLGLPKNFVCPRPTITGKIYNYINDHNLQDPKDKRIIIPDEKLIKLFDIKKGEVIGFKTMQTMIKKVYDKQNNTEVTPAAPVVPVTEEAPKKTPRAKKASTPAQ